jgi:hypothetical protein
MGGDKSRAVNAVTLAIVGALGGQTDVQVASNALAPYAANIIGKELGHGEDKNKAAQLAAHAILGAALAYVNGGNPAAGGSAAVASEAAADYLTNQYKDKKQYQDVNGEFQANLLPEDVKTQIRDLTAAIGAVVGGTVGDSAFNAQLSGVVAQNAVENNSLLGDDLRNKVKQGVKWTASQTGIPIVQGVINGVGSVGDGILAIADAFGDTAVSAIHCPLGTSACADAMENNRQKGEAIYQFLANLDLKEQASKIKQSYADLASGDPEKVANAQRVQAEVFTSLGLSATSIKKLGANSVPNIPKLDWSTGWATRGLQWEATLKQALPSDFIDLNSFKTNFKTFDFYNPSTQTAISAKSMDTVSSFNGTNGLKSLEKQMKGYIDDTLVFKRDAQKGGGPFVLTKDKVKNREVQIAIPEGTSKAKMQVINNMVNYGKQNNVKVVVTVTKSGK